MAHGRVKPNPYAPTLNKPSFSVDGYVVNITSQYGYSICNPRTGWTRWTAHLSDGFRLLHHWRFTHYVMVVDGEAQSRKMIPKRYRDRERRPA